MRFGVCTDIENINIVQRFGFDYIEANASVIAALGAEEFEAKRAMVSAADIKCECWNVLFPQTVSLLGKGASDWNDVESYLHHTFKRVAMLGGQVVAFGSGKCRSYPQDMSFFDAHRGLADVIASVGKIADEYQLTVAIEPLNHTETNMICTVAEGAMLVAQLNSENIRLLADGYHMFFDGEPLDNIKRVGKFAHIHIAALDGRRYPTTNDEMLTEFFTQHCGIGYNERVSIEGSTVNFNEDAPKALALLRKLGQGARI